MPTKAAIEKAVLAVTPQSGHAAIKQMMIGMTKKGLAELLETMQENEGIAQSQAGAQAAAQAATIVAQQGGTKRQVKAAAQAAAQATEAAMGGKRKASSGRSKSRSAIRFKSKSKGMTTKAGKAKNKTVIVQALKEVGVQASIRETRAQLQAKLTHANRKKSLPKSYSDEVNKGGDRDGELTFNAGARGSVSPALKKDYNRVRGLMSGPNYSLSTRLAKVYASGKKADGRLVVTQQLIDKALEPRSLDSFSSAMPSERYQMFLQFYKPLLKKAGYSTARGTMGKLTKAGRRMFSKSKSKKSVRKSVKARFQAIKQQGKFPYYLAKGSVRRIGGGPSGPGVVRVVPGKGATPFSRLSDSEKKEILNYLNTDNGKTLRGKGAKRKVDVQGIIDLKKNEKAAKQAARQRAKAAAAKRKAAKQGSSNEWWK